MTATANDMADALNSVAWRDFIMWAWNEPDLRAAFTAATGVALPAKMQAPIDALVDEATGLREARLLAFVDWVTEHHWGLEHAPRTYREDRAQRTKP